MPDDFAASVDTTGKVAVGGSATGDIETSRDVDWFAVEFVAGRTYVIDLAGAASGGGTLGDTMLLGVFDDAGGRASRKSRDGGEGDDARLVFTATESGTHYIAARGGGRDDTGTYTVRVRDQNPPPPPPDPAAQQQPAPQQPPPSVDADATRAGATDLGELSGERLSRKDSVDGGEDAADYWRFTLDETQAVKLSLRRQDANADLFLEDADGNVLHSSTRGGTRSEKVEATLEAGTYYVRVAAEETGTNDYLLRAQADDATLAPETPPAVPVQPSAAQRQTLSTGVVDPDATRDGAQDTGRLWEGFFSTYEYSYKGSVDGQNDRTDYYSFTTSVRQKVDLTLRRQDANADLFLEDAEGTVLASSTKSGKKNETIGATLDPGTYYVRIAAQETGKNDYQLVRVNKQVHEFLPDIAGDKSTTGKVSVDRPVTGDLHEAGDVDWFKVELKAGRVYVVDLKGSSTGHGTLDWPELTGVYDAEGDLVQSGSYLGGSGYNVRLHFTPEEDGTYFIGASGKSETWRPPYHPGHYDGVYTLSVADSGIDDDYTADTGTTGIVPVGGSVTGTIEQPNDIDWFSIAVEEGKIYRVSMTGLQGNPHLHGVYDAEGNQVHDGSGRIGLSAEARVFIIEPTEDTTYYVAAGPGRFRERSGDYTLKAEVIEDDFAADTSTTGTVAVGGSKWGEVQWWGDRDWVAVTLEKGETYQIELHGDFKLNGWSEANQDASGPQATLGEWFLRGGIYDAEGNRIDDAELGWGGLDGRVYWPPGCERGWVNRVEFTPKESGTYYVEVDTGNFRYSRRSLDDPALPDGPAPDEAVGTYMVTVAVSDYVAEAEVDAM